MAEYTKSQLTEMIVGKLQRNFGRTVDEATPHHMFKACALVLRDIMSQPADRDRATRSGRARSGRSTTCPWSSSWAAPWRRTPTTWACWAPCQDALEGLGFSASDLFEMEPDAGLGNGGLGRLAACYLDSMTTLEIPATGYSICYELGIFKQKIIDGQQVELADNWLGLGDAWLIPKLDETEEVRFGGKVEDDWDENGVNHPEHVGYTTVLAIPRDMEIAGYRPSTPTPCACGTPRAPSPWTCPSTPGAST